MHLLVVKFHSPLPDHEVRRTLEERIPLIENVQGLVQKYYTREASTGDYVGVHVFDSEDALERYRASAVASSFPTAFHLVSPSRIESLAVLFVLRPELRLEDQAAEHAPAGRCGDGGR